jgi:hypothetical protein
VLFEHISYSLYASFARKDLRMKYLYTHIKFLIVLLALSNLPSSQLLAEGPIKASTVNSKLVKGDKTTPTISGYSDLISFFGEPDFILVDPTSNSSGAFSYVSSNTNIAEINGKQVTIKNAGSTTITITQAETETFSSASVTINLTVNKAIANLTLRINGVAYGENDIVQASFGDQRYFSLETNSDVGFQDIQFDLLDDYLDPYIDFSSLPLIRAIKVGTTTLEVRIPETANYLSVKQRLTIDIARKEIVILPDNGQFKRYGQIDPVLSFDISTSLIGDDEFAGSLSRAGGEDAGNYAINLGSLSAGTNYELKLDATSVDFEIRKALQTVGFTPLPQFMVGDADYTLHASADSGRPITFVSDNPNVADVYMDASNGNVWKLKIIAEGSAKITALQSGNSNYEAASASQDITVIAGTLGVNLAYFDVKATAGGVLLTWKTLSETENSRFEIYRSADGSNFSKIAETNGAGNSNTALTYNYTDGQALNATNYYELRQVDYSGKVNHLGIKSINFAVAAATVNVYPNPTTDKIEVLLNGVDYSALQLYDLNGRELQQVKISKNETVKHISLATYPSGVYLLKLHGAAGTMTKKVIKK